MDNEEAARGSGAAKGKTKFDSRLWIYIIATFGFAVLPIVVHVLQRGALSGDITFSDLFPSPDWFVYCIAIWAATLAELGHEQKIGAIHLLIAISATIVVVLASYQYALLSSMLEALRLGKSGSGELASGSARWFSGWNIGLSILSTVFAIGVKLTEKRRLD
ncbi:MAG TPA: hypothetical protein VFI45_07860 [Candidatus Acidoferrum sp.]|nr:hypothetical protein [Candidatus Acidoferrum sp.]